jgi:predicted ABC-type sugar transport system permease subunit
LTVASPPASRAHEIGQWVGRLVFPAVGQVDVLGDGPWLVTLRYTVIVAGWLVLARFAFARRELSYS